MPLRPTPVRASSLPPGWPSEPSHKRARLEPLEASHGAPQRTQDSLSAEGPRLPPELLDRVVAAVPKTHIRSLAALEHTSRGMAARVARLHPEPDRAEVTRALRSFNRGWCSFPEGEVAACLGRTRVLHLDGGDFKRMSGFRLMAALSTMVNVRFIDIAEATDTDSYDSGDEMSQWNYERIEKQWPTLLGKMRNLRQLTCDGSGAGFIADHLYSAGLTMPQLESFRTWPQHVGDREQPSDFIILDLLVAQRLTELHLDGMCTDDTKVIKDLERIVRGAPRLRSLELPNVRVSQDAEAAAAMRAVFTAIAAHKQLEHFSVDLKALNAEGLEALERAIRAQGKLTSLRLHGLRWAKPARAAIAKLIDAAPSLQSLALDMEDEKTSGDQLCLLEAMASCRYLRHLSLGSQSITICDGAIELWAQRVGRLIGLTSVDLQRAAIMPQDPQGFAFIDAVLNLPRVRAIAVMSDLEDEGPIETGSRRSAWLEHIEQHPAKWQKIEALKTVIGDEDEAERLTAAAGAMQSLKQLQVCLTDKRSLDLIQDRLALLDERGIAWQIEYKPWR